MTTPSTASPSRLCPSLYNEVAFGCWAFPVLKYTSLSCLAEWSVTLEAALQQPLSSYIDVTLDGQIRTIEVILTCGPGWDGSGSRRDSLTKGCHWWKRLKVEHSTTPPRSPCLPPLCSPSCSSPRSSASPCFCSSPCVIDTFSVGHKSRFFPKPNWSHPTNVFFDREQ